MVGPHGANTLISMTADAIKHWPARKKLTDIQENLAFRTTKLNVIPTSMVKELLKAASGMKRVNINTDNTFDAGLDEWMYTDFM